MIGDLRPEAAGTRLRLIHAGSGPDDDRDRVYVGPVVGWTEALASPRAGLDEGRAKQWTWRPGG